MERTLNMDSKEIADFDQAASVMADSYPPIWKRMWDNLLELGFTKTEALKLLQAHVHGMAGGKLQ